MSRTRHLRSEHGAQERKNQPVKSVCLRAGVPTSRFRARSSTLSHACIAPELASHRGGAHRVPAPRRGPPLSVVSNISPPVDWSQDRPTLQQENHMSCNPCWSDFSSPSIAITNLPKQPRLTCPKWPSSAAVKQEPGMPKAARRILNFWPLLAPTLLCVFCPDCCSVLLSSAVQCCPDPHHVSLVLLFPLLSPPETLFYPACCILFPKSAPSGPLR